MLSCRWSNQLPLSMGTGASEKLTVLAVTGDPETESLGTLELNQSHTGFQKEPNYLAQKFPNEIKTFSEISHTCMSLLGEGLINSLNLCSIYFFLSFCNSVYCHLILECRVYPVPGVLGTESILRTRNNPGRTEQSGVMKKLNRLNTLFMWASIARSHSLTYSLGWSHV